MAKFYLNLLASDDKMYQAAIDLDNLPKGCSPSIVMHPFKHGEEIIRQLIDNEKLATKLISNISTNTFGEEELEFISNIASFWQNLPPATEERDGFIGIAGEKGDFLRPDPASAKELVEKMSKIGA